MGVSQARRRLPTITSMREGYFGHQDRVLPPPVQPQATCPHVGPNGTLFNALCCPLSCDDTYMKDPVMVVASGHTYERTQIEHWFHLGHDTDPLTNQQTDRMVVPNEAVREFIAVLSAHEDEQLEEKVVGRLVRIAEMLPQLASVPDGYHSRPEDLTMKKLVSEIRDHHGDTLMGVATAAPATDASEEKAQEETPSRTGGSAGISTPGRSQTLEETLTTTDIAEIRARHAPPTTDIDEIRARQCPIPRLVIRTETVRTPRPAEGPEDVYSPADISLS